MTAAAKPKPCPFPHRVVDGVSWRARSTSLGEPRYLYSVCCEDCGAAGPECESRAEGDAAWNRIQLAPAAGVWLSDAEAQEVYDLLGTLALPPEYDGDKEDRLTASLRDRLRKHLEGKR